MKKITYMRALSDGPAPAEGYPLTVRTPHGSFTVALRRAPRMGAGYRWEVDHVASGRSLSVCAPRNSRLSIKAALDHVAEQVAMRAEKIAEAERLLRAVA